MEQWRHVGAEPTLTRLAPESNPHRHLVEFYESDESLVDSVVQFLTPALEAGEAAIVVATRQHRHRFEAALAARGLDVTAPHQRSQLISLDAAQTLAAFMLDGAPDPARFRTVVGGLIERVTESGRAVRIYGEMVALLWEAGNIAGAVALEDLWNELADSRPFSLFCAYPISVFKGEESTAAFRTVCEQHSAVIPSESYSKLSDPGDRLRAVALLQQEASAGTHERVELRRKQSELEAALDRLRELDRLRNEFVAMVVHDIRMPATIVSEFLGLLRDSWSELDEDEIQGFLSKAIENSKRIERLVADILTMARMDSGEFTCDLQAVDLGRLVERVVSEVSGATGRSITFSCEGDLSPALADEIRQVQILTNLLTNAVKFSPETSTVFVSIVHRGDRLEVNVRDEGVGIDPQDVAKLFRPFSRLSQRSERGMDGTGLGLYIAKELVEDQGGTIWVDSLKGKGSTFTYTVPTLTATR